MQSKALLAAATALSLAAGSASAANPKTETRNVGAFDAVEMRGAAKVDITVGKPQSVTIEADVNEVAHIITEVRGTTLVIRRDENWWTDWRPKHVHIAIAMPKLAGYSLEGTAETNITGLNGGTTAFSLNGTGNVKASGKLDRVSLNLNGTGNADFSNVPVDVASISVNGTGSVQVKPAKELTASVNGVGSVIYDGAPQHLTTSINGVGSVRQAQSQ
ncbi:MAG: DUF2807 domain-containing protein [Alphaproteobacteria bacterium]